MGATPVVYHVLARNGAPHEHLQEITYGLLTAAFWLGVQGWDVVGRAPILTARTAGSMIQVRKDVWYELSVVVGTPMRVTLLDARKGHDIYLSFLWGDDRTWSTCTCLPPVTLLGNILGGLHQPSFST